MTWLTWRLLRVQLGAVYAGVVAVAVVLAVTGPRLARLAATRIGVFDQMTSTDRALYYVGVVVMAVVPVLIGMFWGAPLVARELESGTHRLAWNQSVTRGRWLAVKLGLTLATAMLGVGLLSLAVTWWSGALDGATSQTRGSLPSRLHPLVFAMRGLAPVGYTAFAATLGVALGVTLRRTLPAMALTLVVFTLVQGAVPLWVRPHLASPVRTTVVLSRSTLDSIGTTGSSTQLEVRARTGDPRDWVLTNQTVDAHGVAVGLPAWFVGCLPTAGDGGAGVQRGNETTALDDCFTRLADAGYRQRLVYQPMRNFWALQWAETALFLAASAGLAGVCFWRIRRVW